MINKFLKKYGYELVKLDYDYEKYKSQIGAINSSINTEITDNDIDYITACSGILIKPSTLKWFCEKYSKRAINRYMYEPRLSGENETDFIERIVKTDEVIVKDIDGTDDTSGVIANKGAIAVLIQNKSKESIGNYKKFVSF